jgi:hypothetical protein
VLARRLVTVFVAVYLLLDFSLPMVRGAFEFDPDESVDCARIEPVGNTVPAPLPAPIATTPRCRERIVVRPVRVSLALVVAEPAGVARDHLRAAADSPPPSEDH